MSAVLRDPERHWERRRPLGSVDVAEVERCLGRKVDEPIVVLSGGHANTNVRIGSTVLRIHRRDRTVRALEITLNRRPWTSFRVPAVLAEGDGFLVLEWVEHGPLRDVRAHGEAVGQALAEIHAVTMPGAGDLDDSLAIRDPYADLVDALVGYARSQFEDERSGLRPELRARAVRLLEANTDALREVAGQNVLLHGDFKPSNLHWSADDRLLVLDWEFAYAGSRLSDIGQLLRWSPSAEFVAGFASAYRGHGGQLVDGWERWAAAFDLINVSGLAVSTPTPPPDSARVRDLEARVEATITQLER